MKGFTSKVLHFAFVLAQELFAKHNKTAGENGLQLCQYSIPFILCQLLPGIEANVFGRWSSSEILLRGYFGNCKAHIRAGAPNQV